MNNFSIRTATDPDRGSRTGVDQHELATQTFSRILWALCKANGVTSTDHERAGELYHRAAFDTALELGCELRTEDKGSETEITFDFVGTVEIIEVEDNDSEFWDTREQAWFENGGFFDDFYVLDWTAHDESVFTAGGSIGQ